MSDNSDKKRVTPRFNTTLYTVTEKKVTSNSQKQKRTYNHEELKSRVKRILTRMMEGKPTTTTKAKVKMGMITTQ